MGLDDARCILPLTFAKETLVVLKQMLSPENVMHAGCRVKRHPGACALCVANNDCSRLPIHPQCRCKPEPFLTSME